jgi:hypothetical protein
MQSTSGAVPDEPAAARVRRAAAGAGLVRCIAAGRADLTWNLIAFAGTALMTGRAGVAGSVMFRSDAGTAA